MFNFLAGPFADTISKNFNGNESKWFKPVVEVLDNLIWPITIIAFIAGAIWLVWLGVQLAKAEGDDAQKKAKKAIINVAIALASVLVMFWVLTWVAANFYNWIDPASSSNPLMEQK